MLEGEPSATHAPVDWRTARFLGLERAHALALHTSAGDVGKVLGGVGMGAVAAAFGPPAAMQATGAVGVAGAVAFALRTRPSKQ